MRLVYVCQSGIPSPSANSVQVMKMCAAFAAAGHEVTLLAPETTSPEDAFSFYGVPPSFEIVRIADRGRVFRGLRRAADWRGTIRGLRPDCVYGRSVHACALASSRGYATVYESHTPIWQRSRLERIHFRRWVRSRGFRHLVVISRALGDMYAERGLVDREDIVVAHDGADEAPAADRAPREWPGRDEALQIGYVGRLYQWKGMEVVLALARALPDVDVHVVGGNSEQVDLWRKRAESPNVFFHGTVPARDVPSYIARMDICLLPNQRDMSRYGEEPDRQRPDMASVTSPLKLFEYMALGKPIVASDLPVLREVLSPDNSILVDPEDADGWVRAIHTLRDAKVREDLGAAARRDLARNYTWRKRAETVLISRRMPAPCVAGS